MILYNYPLLLPLHSKLAYLCLLDTDVVEDAKNLRLSIDLSSSYRTWASDLEKGDLVQNSCSCLLEPQVKGSQRGFDFLPPFPFSSKLIFFILGFIKKRKSTFISFSYTSFLSSVSTSVLNCRWTISFHRADAEEEHASFSGNSTSETVDLTEIRKRNISIYGGLVVGTFLLGYAGVGLFLYVTVSASRNLHDRMFEKLVGATIYFFDHNPVGKWVLTLYEQFTVKCIRRHVFRHEMFIECSLQLVRPFSEDFLIVARKSKERFRTFWEVLGYLLKFARDD